MNHALLIIDIQNDYFPAGKWPLFEVEPAADKASKILQQARELGQKVVHVCHEFLHENPTFFAPDSHGAAHYSCRALMMDTGSSSWLRIGCSPSL